MGSDTTLEQIADVLGDLIWRARQGKADMITVLRIARAEIDQLLADHVDENEAAIDEAERILASRPSS